MASRPYMLRVKLTNQNDLARLNALVQVTRWSASDVVRRLLRAVKVRGPDLQLQDEMVIGDRVLGTGRHA